MAPSVSVVIPTYNRGAYIERSVRSVLDELAADDELIVVDDGSQDDTAARLQKFSGRITVLRGDHRGAGCARNLGIAHATKELVGFLDSDDVWLPGKLEIQRRLLASRPGLLFVFGDFCVQDRDGIVHRRFLGRWPRVESSWKEDAHTSFMYSSVASLPSGVSDFRVVEADFYSLQLTGFYILTNTLVVRRTEAGDSLHFDEDLVTYEDLECFYRLARRGQGAFMDVEVACQFDHSDGRLSHVAGLQKLDARLLLTRRHWGQDEKFLAQHSARYERAVDALLCTKAGHLVSRGRTREARRVLGEASQAPGRLRLVAWMPGWLAVLGISLVRVLKRLVRGFSA